MLKSLPVSPSDQQKKITLLSQTQTFFLLVFFNPKPQTNVCIYFCFYFYRITSCLSLRAPTQQTS